MQTFAAQLQEYMTSINNEPAYGLDHRLPALMKELHASLDALISQIDTMKSDAKTFADGYSKQLEDKHNFYKTQDEEDKKKDRQDKREEKKREPDAPLDIPADVLEDIRYGADNIKVALKEKYLGREEGKKRGETTLSYSSDMLTICMSSAMILILAFTSR